MGVAELKAKYPHSRLSVALNAAVRAELIGGGQVLDAWQLLKEAERAYEKREMEEYLPDLRLALHYLEQVKLELRAVIRDRYDIPEDAK